MAAVYSDFARPGWTEVLRYPPGSTMRFEVLLPPALREALAGRSARAAALLHALDGARLHVVHVEASSCVVRCMATAAGSELAALEASEDAPGQHTLRLRSGPAWGESLELVLNDVALCTGGRHDAYLTRRPADGGQQLLARLRHAPEANTLVVSVFGAALLPAAARSSRVLALLPTGVDVLRLFVEAGESSQHDWDRPAAGYPKAMRSVGIDGDGK